MKAPAKDKWILSTDMLEKKERVEHAPHDSAASYLTHLQHIFISLPKRSDVNTPKGFIQGMEIKNIWGCTENIRGFIPLSSPLAPLLYEITCILCVYIDIYKYNVLFFTTCVYVEMFLDSSVPVVQCRTASRSPVPTVTSLTLIRMVCWNTAHHGTHMTHVQW